MKLQKIIFIFWVSSLIANSQDIFNVIPFKSCSYKYDFIPFWITNPLNLKSKGTLEASFSVSPSKFLLKELNSVGCYVNFSLPYGFNSALSLDYLGGNKFSYSNFRLAFQKVLFNRFNFATTFGSDLISVEAFGILSKLNWNIFFEYLIFDMLQISFVYKNLFGINDFKNQSASLGFQYNFENICTFGSGISVFLNTYTSYKFYITFTPIDRLLLDVDIQTNPQAITFSIGSVFDDFSLSFFLQYNNLLMLSQTICITLMF